MEINPKNIDHVYSEGKPYISLDELIDSFEMVSEILAASAASLIQDGSEAEAAMPYAAAVIYGNLVKSLEYVKQQLDLAKIEESL